MDSPPGKAGGGRRVPALIMSHRRRDGNRVAWPARATSAIRARFGELASSAANPVEPLTSSKRCTGRERESPGDRGLFARSVPYRDLLSVGGTTMTVRLRPAGPAGLGLALALALPLALAIRTARAQDTTKGWNPMHSQKRSDAELRRALNPLQYEVTQHEATEPPFRNEYW